MSPPNCLSNVITGGSYALRKLTWKQLPSRSSVPGFGLVESVQVFCRAVYLQSKLTTFPSSVHPLPPFLYIRLRPPPLSPHFGACCFLRTPFCVFFSKQPSLRVLLQTSPAIESSNCLQCDEISRESGETVNCASQSDFCGLAVRDLRVSLPYFPPVRHSLAIRFLLNSTFHLTVSG